MPPHALVPAQMMRDAHHQISPEIAQIGVRKQWWRTLLVEDTNDRLLWVYAVAI